MYQEDVYLVFKGVNLAGEGCVTNREKYLVNRPGVVGAEMVKISSSILLCILGELAGGVSRGSLWLWLLALVTCDR